MKKKKLKPVRKNFFERFDKFWKSSKFEFEAKNKKLGRKKFKLMLIFIFLMIDSKNMKFQNNLAIPTHEKIAAFVGCHVSWVKQVKHKYFSDAAKKLEKEEFDEYRKKLNLVFAYERIHGWKNFAILNQETEFEFNNPKPLSGNSCFKTNWKRYINWFTFDSKPKPKFKFFKWTEICFDNYFEKIITSSKSGRAKKNFVKNIFKKNYLWHNVSWFWRVIDWFRTNLKFWFDKTKLKNGGLLAKI